MSGRSTCWRLVRPLTLVLVLLAIAPGCERPLGGGHYDAPLVRLLANPDEFDSKRVLTSGYLWFGVDGPTLFLSEADAVHGVVSNGVALVFAEALAGDQTLRARADRKYVAITGLFENLGTGDMVLTEVDEVMVYSKKEGETRN